MAAVTPAQVTALARVDVYLKRQGLMSYSDLGNLCHDLAVSLEASTLALTRADARLVRLSGETARPGMRPETLRAQRVLTRYLEGTKR